MVQQYRTAGKTVVYVAVDNQLIGLIAIHDTPKPESKQVIEYLHKNSIQVWMISGDHEITAISVADQLGIAPEFVVAGKEGYDRFRLTLLTSFFLKVFYPKISLRKLKIFKLWAER